MFKNRKNQSKESLQKILNLADIQINGNRPWDMQIHNLEICSKILAKGSLALGESYMNKEWDCNALDQFFCKILKANLDKKVRTHKKFIFDIIKARIINLQSKLKAFEVGEKHYDIGNNLYKNMLDKKMVYTCGYWKDAKNLDQAQELKLNLVCQKINLKPGMKVLDIGCGWGSFAKFAATKYKAKVVGITISKEQAKLAEENCKGLPVQIKLKDYRDINEKFDAVVSLGMFEHVGYKNYKTYMKIVSKCLKKDGLFLLHTIGINHSSKTPEPWIHKYIFPNGMLPSAKQITSATEGLFILEDWHNFGQDYDKTLMEWYKNFTKNWSKIKEDYDEKFYRMWKYYLLMCAGSFRAKQNQLWQIVFSKKSSTKEYKSIR